MVFYKLLFVLSIFINSSSVQAVNVLELEAGDICRKSEGLHADYVCTHLKKCAYLTDSRTNNSRLSIDICSYDVWEPIVCCPPSTVNGTSIIEPANKTDTLSYADKQCRQYSELAYKYDQELELGSGVNTSHGIKNVFFITGGTNAKTSEFPHMALLGYGDTVEDKEWRCGGSLISERWILTAAHCKYVPLVGLARWARLGHLNIFSTTNDPQLEDHWIVEHVIHPDYELSARYNDIALFRLEKEVKFSKYVRPICLNADPLINPTVQIATGWGQIYTGGPPSAVLLKVELNNIPTKQCNNSYFEKNNPKLKFGIISDMMICAGSVNGGRDTCTGDSGGPLQVKHFDYKNMYLQVGITSFGKFCGDKNSPGVYTRVSKYVSWIENMVWPQSKIGNAN